MQSASPFSSSPRGLSQRTSSVSTVHCLLYMYYITHAMLEPVFLLLWWSKYLYTSLWTTNPCWPTEGGLTSGGKKIKKSPGLSVRFFIKATSNPEWENFNEITRPPPEDNKRLFVSCQEREKNGNKSQSDAAVPSHFWPSATHDFLFHY